ncbi:choice-of-anchor L domain-containing protein [Neptunomonas phycophila]|uniref:Choice-of-anchor L domain-containing protein n=1 Tax=Neptunomonas phycophila TaxID=1572645 RepID=A0ABT9EY67_9GAMM|nr:choice-of-anchor L domain-containing protein [Neptunomonas phycophila]MDP2523986.1 choice-of-anchor L domain-containing protein [Neptunomonas phycophila]
MKKGNFGKYLLSASLLSVGISSVATANEITLGVAELTTLSDAEILAQALIQDGITSIDSVTYTGALSASGLFTGGSAAIGIEKGAILTSGNVINVLGPNTSNSAGSSNGMPGSALLDTLIESSTPSEGDGVIQGSVLPDGLGVTNIDQANDDFPTSGTLTHDASILTFDFTPQGDQLEFSYVFGSEEYPEFANSSFNDVFGFFVNDVNYALLPDGSPVAINNVNADRNSEFYIDNTNEQRDTELDGLTTVLSFAAPVNPGVSNTITLAIADTSDDVYDSAVFIQGDFSSSVSDGAAAGSTQLNPLMPDEINEETGGFSFTFEKSDEMIFIDPEVAIGYTYEMLSDNTFESILLPLIGDGEYILSIYDSVIGDFVGNFQLEDGVIYDFDTFTSEEVTLFQILGIETTAALDPTDTTAFITGLTFGGSNNIINMTQTPIVANVPTSDVPAPMTLALFGLGLALIIRRKVIA